MKVDSHQHFWKLDRGDYDWLTPELSALYRDYLPNDLTPLLEQHNIDGTVLVQAAPSTAETHYMLELAQQHDFIKGVVGWVDFDSPDAASTIADISQHDKLVGLRPMIQSIEDPQWMLLPSLNNVFEAMVEHGLVFDALTLPVHLKYLHELLCRHPELKAVIDHGSKPNIADNNFESWATDIARIASDTQASVKCSGLVTESGDTWSVSAIKPFFEHLLTSFGTDRILWGSDWPVCTLAASYTEWLDATHQLLSALSDKQQQSILGDNAVNIYSLS